VITRVCINFFYSLIILQVDSKNLQKSIRKMKRIDTEFLLKKNPFGSSLDPQKLYRTVEFPPDYEFNQTIEE